MFYTILDQLNDIVEDFDFKFIIVQSVQVGYNAIFLACFTQF